MKTMSRGKRTFGHPINDFKPFLKKINVLRETWLTVDWLQGGVTNQKQIKNWNWRRFNPCVQAVSLVLFWSVSRTDRKIFLHQHINELDRRSELLQAALHRPGQRQEPAGERADKDCEACRSDRLDRSLQRHLEVVQQKPVPVFLLGIRTASRRGGKLHRSKLQTLRSVGGLAMWLREVLRLLPWWDAISGWVGPKDKIGRQTRNDHVSDKMFALFVLKTLNLSHDTQWRWSWWETRLWIWTTLESWKTCWRR